jgi:hypothetical protein
MASLERNSFFLEMRRLPVPAGAQWPSVRRPFVRRDSAAEQLLDFEERTRTVTQSNSTTIAITVSVSFH